MEDEARLLEAFSSLPNATRAWALPAATHDGVRVSLQLSQRNLPANGQRKYLTSFLLNEAVLEAGEPDVSLPAEQTGVMLYSPSPSGRRALVVRSGSADASAGGAGGSGWCWNRVSHADVFWLMVSRCVLEWCHHAGVICLLPYSALPQRSSLSSCCPGGQSLPTPLLLQC